MKEGDVEKSVTFPMLFKSLYKSILNMEIFTYK